MKYLLICLFLTGVSFNTSTAQLIDSVYPEMNKSGWMPYRSVQSLYPIDDTSFIVVHISGRVFGMHRDGRKLWETGVLYSEHIAFMITGSLVGGGSPPKKLMLSYYHDECDTYDGFAKTIIDLITKEINSPPTGSSGNGIYIFPELPSLPGYLLVNDKWVKFYYNQDSILRQRFNDRILGFDINSKGDFILMTSDSMLFFQNNNGEFLLYKKANHLIAENKLWIRFSTDSTFIINSTNAAHLYNKDLEFVKRQNLPLNKSNPKVTRKWHDPYFVALVESDFYSILVFDKFLNAVITYDVPLIERDLSDAIYLNDSIIITSGWEYNFDNLRTFIKGFDLKKQNVRTDISITNVVYDEASPRSSNDCWMEPLITYDVVNLDIEVTNSGNTIVEKVIIASEHSICSFYCWPEILYHDTIANMNLLPGESKTFSLGDIVIEDDYYDQEDGLCFYALLPDNHADIDGSNDVYCMNEIVSTIETKSDKFLYPNPVEDFLYYEDGLQIKKVTIYSFNSRVLEQEMNGSSVNVEKLVPGIYMIRAEYIDGNVRIDRFIKL